MLKDITIGQYFPADSVIHRLDPRLKIVVTVLMVIVLFFIDSAVSFLMIIGFILAVIAISKIPLKMVVKSVKPIIPLIIITSVLNIFFIGGEYIFEWWIIKVSIEGIQVAILMTTRIICLLMGSSMLTYTTSPIALTDAIEKLLKPLNYIKFPVHEMAMMMTIAMRFIPTLIEETDKIMSAQKARGADLETGGIIKRSKALIPILIPLFISAFRRADELALAMECRCYRGGEGRTRMRKLQLNSVDYIAGIIVILIFVGVILLNIYTPITLENIINA